MAASDYISGATNALVIGKALLEDPALPEVAGLVMRLQRTENGGRAPSSSSGGGRGIGLRNAVLPLKFYVAAKEQPILGYAVVVGILAIPFIAGYLTGRSRR